MTSIIEIKLRDLDKVGRDLQKCGQNAARGVARAINRVTYRGSHTAVKRAVSSVYNVVQKDVDSDSRRAYRRHGSASVFGVSIPTYNIEYYGQEMSYARAGGKGVRFGLRPTKPVAGRVQNRPVRLYKYNGKWRRFPNRPATRQVTAQPKKTGPRSALPSPTGQPVFVGPMKGQNNNHPQARTNAKQNSPTQIIKSGLNVPTMIDDGEVKPKIYDDINARLEKELGRIRL